MSYYVPLPAYNAGPGIDFKPLNEALDGIVQQNNANRTYALQQKVSDRADQQFALDKRDSDLSWGSHLAQQSAGVAQNALNEKDPVKKAGMMNGLYNLHPEYRDRLTKAGIDPNDYDGTAKFIVSEARGYVNPLDAEAAQAKIDESRAATAKSNAEVAALRRQGSLVNSLFPELGGVTSDAGPAVSTGAPYTGAPSNAFANFSPPTNALSGRGPTTVTSAPAPMPPRNALATIGRPSAAETFPGSPPGRDADSGSPVLDFARGYRSAPPSMALPAPGDPTSCTGDSASGLVTPSRISADTKRAMAYDLALNGGKGMSTILNNDPGSKYATSYAAKTAEDNASLNMKQKMTAPLLAQIQHMRELATDAGSDVLTKATGPDYSEGQEGSWLPGFLHPDTSGQPYQNFRAMAQHANPFSDQKSYDDAASLNLQMQHIKKMLGASVKALPGTKGGGASTDQDQALVLDAVGEALHAQDPETFFKILHDAQNGLRARSGMPPLPTPKSFIPDQWNTSSPAAQANPKADALAGARDAIAKGADPSAVRQRLLQNGINPEGL